MISDRPADWQEKDLAFHFDTGRPCLDFVATVGDRAHEAFDRWHDPEDLSRWFAEADMAADQPTLDAASLDAARKLREAIYRLVSGRLRGVAPDRSDVDHVNACAVHPPPAPQLSASGDTVEPQAWAGLEAVLSLIARDAIALLVDGDLSRVRECAEESCSVLFVDTSRPGKRRWCSMDRCGNRAKKRAFRARHAASD